jgi:hypothetical protein
MCYDGIWFTCKDWAKVFIYGKAKILRSEDMKKRIENIGIK